MCICVLTFRQKLSEALCSHKLLFGRGGEDHLGHVLGYNTTLMNKEQQLNKLLLCSAQSWILFDSSLTKW